jgi:hypothetical protein
MAAIGAELVHVAAGEADIAVPFSERLTQQDGYLHPARSASHRSNDLAGGRRESRCFQRLSGGARRTRTADLLGAISAKAFADGRPQSLSGSTMGLAAHPLGH